ncbi:MAG: tetratricopeptide repeat protein [Propionibacteriaceae bacterium]|nr:tetratricopeptide repeat protein [Propionibacteriaceae bacterium]
MTSASFSSAVDFSTLAQAPAGASYVLDVNESNLDALMRKSMQHPVVLELTSARAHGAAQLSATLAGIANASAGRFLLGRVDIDASPRIAQALQIQAVPMVVAVIAGQLAPLFQGTADKADIEKLLEQVFQAAAANGVIGKADPVSAATEQGGQAPAADPRFAAADEALAAGDYQRAVEEFDKILAATPGDAEAVAGRAQAALLVRSLTFDPARIKARAADSPTDVAAQFDAADLEIINGAVEEAFDRLLALAAQLDAEAREQVRVRLLELFEVVGRTQPTVLKARRRLSGLLF